MSDTPTVHRDGTVTIDGTPIGSVRKTITPWQLFGIDVDDVTWTAGYPDGSTTTHALRKHAAEHLNAEHHQLVLT